MEDKSKIRILIVEDDQFLREFYQELLQAEGFTVDAAVDGEMALVKIKEGGFNLIMLDIMMPKKDGLQVLREMKLFTPTQPNGNIVVLTNLGHDSIIKQCFELGASGYLVKSAMNPDQVLTEINSYLQKTN